MGAAGLGVFGGVFVEKGLVVVIGVAVGVLVHGVEVGDGEAYADAG